MTKRIAANRRRDENDARDCRHERATTARRSLLRQGGQDVRWIDERRQRDWREALRLGGSPLRRIAVAAQSVRANPRRVDRAIDPIRIGREQRREIDNPRAVCRGRSAPSRSRLVYGRGERRRFSDLFDHALLRVLFVRHVWGPSSKDERGAYGAAEQGSLADSDECTVFPALG